MLPFSLLRFFKIFLSILYQFFLVSDIFLPFFILISSAIQVLLHVFL